MSLIDASYFWGEINLPANKYSDLDSFIERFEKELIVKLFGYTLYKLINAYNPDKPTDTDQRIRDIIEGKEFTLNEQTYKWNGLRNTEKVSVIAYYVYVHYMRGIETQTTTTGESKNKKVNSVSVSPVQKISNAWTQMRILIGPYCLQAEYYPGYSTDYYNSLFFFMSNFYDTYPEWEWSEIGSINSFDL